MKEGLSSSDNLKPQVRYLFVGEEPSEKALKMGVTWEDGRLAARQLFDALEACGINPSEQKFINLFEDGTVIEETVIKIRKHITSGGVVVGMGRKVQAVLADRELAHLAIVHPAARGKIRKKSRYEAQIRKTLV